MVSETSMTGVAGFEYDVVGGNWPGKGRSCFEEVAYLACAEVNRNGIVRS